IFVPEAHPVSVFMAGSPGAGKTEISDPEDERGAIVAGLEEDTAPTRTQKSHQDHFDDFLVIDTPGFWSKLDGLTPKSSSGPIGRY
ncbi:MAG: zeta toxin family protein, partial [Acidobacteriaceae bacterium]